MTEGPRLYGELASWFHLLTAPDEYAEEAEIYRRLLDGATTVLELGSGGGNNASHLKRHFEMTLVDASEAMLEMSRGINPESRHLIGDMRTVRLDETFDGVFIHDAIDYMTTLEDLRATMETAFVHLGPGGVAVFAPDHVRETFHPGTEHGGNDDEERGLRYLEWTLDPDPSDTTYITDYAYILREKGEVRVVYDQHICGLFSREEWRAADPAPERRPRLPACLPAPHAVAGPDDDVAGRWTRPPLPVTEPDVQRAIFVHPQLVDAVVGTGPAQVGDLAPRLAGNRHRRGLPSGGHDVEGEPDRGGDGLEVVSEGGLGDRDPCDPSREASVAPAELTDLVAEGVQRRDRLGGGGGSLLRAVIEVGDDLESLHDPIRGPGPHQGLGEQREDDAALRARHERQRRPLLHVFGSTGSVTAWSRSHPSCSSTSISIATSPLLASRLEIAWYTDGQQR